MAVTLWGPLLPVWYCSSCSGNQQGFSQGPSTVLPPVATGLCVSSAWHIHYGMPLPWGHKLVRGCTVSQNIATVLSSQPTGISSPSYYPTRAEGVGPKQGAQLDISSLDGGVEQLLESSVAPATLKAYKPAQQRYSSFCMKYNIQPLFPLQEDILWCYVAFLAQQHLKYCTIN